MECEKISLRRSRDSISILVVDDDTTCLSFVAALLKKLKYEVVTAKHPNDALCALRIKGGAFDLVVSDVHMPDMNGFELQEAITNEFNLPVVLMSVDSKEVVFSKGLESGAAFFISKPVSPNDLKDLWQFASVRKKRSQVVIEECRNYFPENNSDSAVKEGRQHNKEISKRKSPSKDTKKHKVIWTNALHYRFLEAIRTIGLEKSVPKKILEVMNVPGLTRENVASHLQKYRIFLKRVSDASYEVEIGDDDGLISRSSISNYSSSRSRHSLLTLNRSNKPQFHEFPSQFWYQESPSSSLIDQLISAKPNMRADRIDRSSQVGTTSAEAISALVSNDYFKNLGFNIGGNDHQLQNNIVNLDQPAHDQCLGVDSCSNRQRSSDVVGDYDQDHLPPPPSNLSFIEKEFCSLYHHDLPAFDIMAAQQPSNPTHQPNIIQERNGSCEYSTSATSLLCGAINNSSYHQPVYLQQVQGAIQSVEFNKPHQSPDERDDDDVLESLLAFGAFGEDQIQTLEGI